MAEKLSDKLIAFLATCEGKEVSLKYLRAELRIDPNSPAWDSIRVYMKRLAEKGIVKPSGKQDGIYKVVKRVEPVRVFIPGRERRPVFNLRFPEDKSRGIEIDIAEHIVIREGDLITLGGGKNKSKTLLCLLLAAANIDRRPVLMGNEYTIFTEGKYEPAPRFFDRLERMSEWVDWVDEDGNDRFTLLPVRDDYAEHIVRDRINIIDWINLAGGQLYDISKVLEECKSAVGKGILIVAIQKGEDAKNPRGGQFVRDFSDVEILLDGLGDSDDEILMTIKGVKEKTGPIVGKTYAYKVVEGGTQVWNFREVKKCPLCRGTGYTREGQCESCFGAKYIDK